MHAAGVCDPQRPQRRDRASREATGRLARQHPGKIATDLRRGGRPGLNLELLGTFPFHPGDICCHQVTTPLPRNPGFEGTVPGPITLLFQRSDNHFSVGISPPTCDRLDLQRGVVSQYHQRLATGNNPWSRRDNSQSLVLARHAKLRANSLGRDEHPTIGPGIGTPVTTAGRGAVEDRRAAAAASVYDVIMSSNLADDIDAFSLPLVEP